MKLSRTSNESGGVLFTALILSLLVSLVVGALLMLSKQQSYLTARSMTWCSEIPIAEAGVEESLALINSGLTNWAVGGWQLDAARKVYFQRRNVGENGYFYATVTTSSPPTIVSIGYGRIPLQTNFTHRTILVTTKRTPPVWGIVGKDGVFLNGSGAVDSFNSTNPAMSTLGRFDPLKRQDRAGVGTPSTAKPAINAGTARIYGYASTGPGGTVTGTVGDGSWVSSDTTGVQPGHSSDDFNMAFTEVLPPFTSSSLFPTGKTNIAGVTYEAVYGSGDYMHTGDVTPKGNVLIGGKTRIYVTGKFTINNGALIIAPGASLELYVGGDGQFMGNGVINLNNNALTASFYGLSTCTTLKFGGNSELQARIYAPTAAVELAGNADISGAIVGRTVVMQGNADIHYDEALGSTTQEFRVASWEEL